MCGVWPQSPSGHVELQAAQLRCWDSNVPWKNRSALSGWALCSPSRRLVPSERTDSSVPVLSTWAEAPACLLVSPSDLASFCEAPSVWSSQHFSKDHALRWASRGPSYPSEPYLPHPTYPTEHQYLAYKEEDIGSWKKVLNYEGRIFHE